jgi:hypothetical protein
MGDNKRLSIASSSGLKGVAASVANFKRTFTNRQSPSSLSKY